MDGQYQAKTEITATILQVKPVEYSQKSGKPGQSLYVELDSGEKDWIKFTGKGVADAPLDHNAENQRAIFLVWPFRPEQAAKTYLYCWIQRQTSQRSPQSRQQPPQQANPAQGGDTQAEFIKLAERLITAIEYVVHGNVQPPTQVQATRVNPDHVDDDPKPVDDSDTIPF